MSTALSAARFAASKIPIEAGHQGQLESSEDALAEGDLHLLDDPLEWSAFSRPDPRDPHLWESNILIEGMHCAACALTLEDALQGVPGVVRADVSAGSHRARVVWSSETCLLYTSDAADDLLCVDLGGRRIIKKKKKKIKVKIVNI